MTGDITGTAARSTYRRWRYAAAIVAGWTLMALLWTPPSILVAQSQNDPANFGAVFLLVWLGFVPWMLVTPALLRLNARYPFEENKILRRLGLHAGIGIVLIPVLSIAGTALNYLVQTPDGVSLFIAFRGSIITALYSVPTYIAVVGIGQILAYLERYRIRERMLARAQLQALQAQLRPHFLFNTLNAIAALGYDDPERADRALTELSALLRLALSDGPAEIALKEEIAFLQNCVDVYALLIPGELTFTMDVAPQAWDARVPRMLLQPLAENAIMHGLARRKAGGALALTVMAEDKALILTLSNDAAETPRTDESNGIGLANVRERLRVLYGEAGSVELTALQGERVEARVRLPLRENTAEA